MTTMVPKHLVLVVCRKESPPQPLAGAVKCLQAIVLNSGLKLVRCSLFISSETENGLQVESSLLPF